MTVGGNRTEALAASGKRITHSCGRGNDQIQRTRSGIKFRNRRLSTKKAGRYPIRVYVGPTKNLLQDDRETPSKI